MNITHALQTLQQVHQASMATSKKRYNDTENTGTIHELCKLLHIIVLHINKCCSFWL